MSVAICATVRNEGQGARALAESLRRQTPVPDQIVVVDGGSSDGSIAELRRVLDPVPHAEVIVAAGANIATGRNAAIARTSSDLIAVTDAGIERSDAWLQALVATARDHPDAAGAFGVVTAGPATATELAVGAVALPLAREIDPAMYPPSSGSLLIRRDWFERAGGYPEWLTFGEDLWLDRRVWELGGWFAHAVGADVQIRPRPNLAAIARQYFNYATGDGQAGMLAGRHALRFAAFGLGLWLSGPPRSPRIGLLALLAGLYLARPYRRLRAAQARWTAAELAQAAAWIPAVRLTGDLAKMAGYLVGNWRRRRP